MTVQFAKGVILAILQMNWTISKTSHKESNIRNIQYVSFLIMKVDR